MRYKLMDKGKDTTVLYGIDKREKVFEKTDVCIEEDGKIYKVVSLTTSGNGDIFVFFHYCKRQDSYVSRYVFDRSGKGGLQLVTNFTHEYFFDSRAKITLHRSGFIQLSGDRINSGVADNGSPKGIGVFSNPLDTPISSGPTFGFQCWGVAQGFEQLKKLKKNVQCIILSRKNNDFRDLAITSNEPLNTYVLEFFIFPKEANELVYQYREVGPYINHKIANFVHEPGALFAHPVVDLQNFEGVIAISPFQTHTEFPETEGYGYITGSPFGKNTIEKDEPMNIGFTVMCPRMNVAGREYPISSLDRVNPRSFGKTD